MYRINQSPFFRIRPSASGALRLTSLRDYIVDVTYGSDVELAAAAAAAEEADDETTDAAGAADAEEEEEVEPTNVPPD